MATLSGRPTSRSYTTSGDITLGGNAVINVRYEQKDQTMATAGYIEGRGLVIIDNSDMVACPYCAETIKREAIKCKHCGSDIPKAST